MARLVALAGAAVIAAATIVAAAPGGGSPAGSTTASAATVAHDFFTTLNERRYERTCRLLAHEYLEAHRLASASECSIGLRIAFMWSQEIRFELGRVRLLGRLAIVEAVADGARGELVLVREGGRLKVLAVRGS